MIVLAVVLTPWVVTSVPVLKVVFWQVMGKDVLVCSI